MRIRRFVLHARRASRSVCDESVPSRTGRTGRTGRVKRPAAARESGCVLYGVHRPLRSKASALRRFFCGFHSGGRRWCAFYLWRTAFLWLITQ